MTAGWRRICCCSFVPLFSPSNYLLGRAQDREYWRKKAGVGVRGVGAGVAEVIAPEHSMNGIVLTLARPDLKSCLGKSCIYGLKTQENTGPAEEK